MTPLVRYSFRFIILIIFQYLLSQMVPLGGIVTPYMYFVFVLWLPFNMSNNVVLWLSAFYGLSFSFLIGSPGIHGAACVLIAFARPYLLKLLAVKDVKELNYAEPSSLSLGIGSYATYVIILTILHHSYLVILQWLTVGNLGFFILKVIMSTIVSVVLIGIIEMLVQRKLKTRASLR